MEDKSPISKTTFTDLTGRSQTQPPLPVFTLSKKIMNLPHSCYTPILVIFPENGRLLIYQPIPCLSLIERVGGISVIVALPTLGFAFLIS